MFTLSLHMSSWWNAEEKRSDDKLNTVIRLRSERPRNRSLIPSREETPFSFTQYPDGLSGALRILSNGYQRIFCGGKTDGA
jgi:hypothetical protein